MTEEKIPTDKERGDLYQILCTYLLYEREAETELRIAFAAMVQERHNTFHDEEGQQTEFTVCGNLVCVNALKILQNARKSRIELNDVSVQMIQPYNLKVQRDAVNRRCVAFIEEMHPQTEEKLVIEV